MKRNRERRQRLGGEALRRRKPRKTIASGTPSFSYVRPLWKRASGKLPDGKRPRSPLAIGQGSLTSAVRLSLLVDDLLKGDESMQYPSFDERYPLANTC